MKLKGRPRLYRYFSFDWDFLRSAQYLFIRIETALRAAGDMRVRLEAPSVERSDVRREVTSSGKVCSMARISARKWLNVSAALFLASSFSRSTLKPRFASGISKSSIKRYKVCHNVEHCSPKSDGCNLMAGFARCHVKGLRSRSYTLAVSAGFGTPLHPR